MEQSEPQEDPELRRRFLIDAFDRHERQLTAYALRFFGGPTGNLEAARDAVQFTFMKLCQQPVRQVAGKLTPWLFTVCRNRILDELKTDHRRFQFDQPAASQVDGRLRDPADQLELDDLAERLPLLLQTLGHSEKEVIELWSHGLKSGEIATVLNRPAGTVRVMLHRGIKKLQQHPEVSRWLERATGQQDRLMEEKVRTTTATGE